MFKTIVVHVGDSSEMSDRLHAAALLANDFEAHLIGSAATGVSYVNYAMLYGSMAMAATEAEFESLRVTGRERLARFEEEARRLGVQSLEGRLHDDESGIALLLQSRYADLLVTGQSMQNQAASAWAAAAGLPSYLALHSGRPVLVVPPGHTSQTPSATIAVGWDGSLHAMRAITFALPLLQRAALVRLLIVNPNPVLETEGDEPGAGMALFLARHGVPVEVTVQRSDSPQGDAILRLAHEGDCGLIVAGAYGHTRFRELVLGGVTRALLTRATIPVFLAH